MSTKDFLNDQSVIYSLIKSELLNNNNLNALINLKVKDITNIDELNSLFLKLVIEEGRIGFSDSSCISNTYFWSNIWSISFK